MVASLLLALIVFISIPNDVRCLNLGGANVRELGLSFVSPSTSVTDNKYSSVVKSVGDLNGDGYGDVAIGLPDEETVNIVLGESTTLADVDLSQLTFTSYYSSNIGEGYKIVGAFDGDMTGYSISRAGDFNNDGYDDLLIGAYNVSAGAVYVIFGSELLSDVELSDSSYLDSSRVVAIYGQKPEDQFGYSVSGGYDLNGDGFADIAISAPGSLDNVGAVYVIYGTSSTTNIDLSSASLSSSQGFVVRGNSGDTGFGYSIALLSDFDNDGFADLCIGAPSYGITSGFVAVIYGNTTNVDLNNTDIATLKRGFTLEGDSYSQTGFSVADAGDVNGDGVSDLIIGMPYARRSYSASQVVAAGGAVVLFGSSVRRTDTTTLHRAGTSIATVYGAALGDFAGYSVNSAGDVNDDGFGDLILGAPYASEDLGVAYVIYGSADFSSLHLAQLSSSEGFTITCSSTYNNVECGRSVDAVDFNGDGLSDVLMSAAYAYSSSQSYDFLAYLILSQLSAMSDMSVDSLYSNGVSVMAGASIGDQAGYSVSGAGDFNGDGIDDLVVGAAGANGTFGSVFIVLGGLTSDYQNNRALSSSESVIAIIGGGDSISLGLHVTAAGDVNRDGLADVLASALDACYLVYGSDETSTVVLNSGDGQSVTISGIASANGAVTCNAAGDFNNDAYADVVVVSQTNTMAYVLFGGFNTASVNATRQAVVDGFTIEFPKSKWGHSNQVFPAGDVNGDEYDDVIVVLDTDVYVVFGNLSSYSSVSLSALNGTRGFYLKPPSSESKICAASAGDINNDGYSDIILGFPYFNDGKGITFVVYGGANLDSVIDLTDLSDNQGFSVSGVVSGGESGYNVGSAGDVNNDGYSDFMISSLLKENAVLVIYGQSDIMTSFDVSAVDADATLGFSIQSASGSVPLLLPNAPSDLDGNGVDDVIVSSPSYLQSTGAIFVAYSAAAPTVHPTHAPTYSSEVVTTSSKHHHLTPLQKFYVAVSIIGTFSFLIAVPILFARFICFRMLDDFGVDQETGYYVSNPAKKRGAFLGAIFKQCSVTYIDAYIEYKEKEARRKELDLDVSLTLQLKAMEDAAEQIDMIEREKQKKAEMIILNGDEEKNGGEDFEEHYPILSGVSPEVMSIINKKRSPRAAALTIETEQKEMETIPDPLISPSNSDSTGKGSSPRKLRQLGMTAYISDDSMSEKRSKGSMGYASMQSMDSVKSGKSAQGMYSASASQLLRDSLDLEESNSDSNFNLDAVLEPVGISTHSILTEENVSESKGLKFKSPSVRFKHVESEDVYDYHEKSHSESLESMLPSDVEKQHTTSTGFGSAFSTDSVDESRLQLQPSLSTQLGIPTIKTQDLSSSTHSIQSIQSSNRRRNPAAPTTRINTDLAGLAARTQSIDDGLLNAKSPNPRSRYSDSGIAISARALTQQVRAKHDLHDVEDVVLQQPSPPKSVRSNSGGLGKKPAKRYEDESILSEIAGRASTVSNLERIQVNRQKLAAAAKSPARTPNKGAGGPAASSGGDSCIVQLVHTVKYDFEVNVGVGSDFGVSLFKWLSDSDHKTGQDFMGMVEPVRVYADSEMGTFLMFAWLARQLIEYTPLFSSMSHRVFDAVKTLSVQFPVLSPVVGFITGFKTHWLHNKALLITLHLIAGHYIASLTHQHHRGAALSWMLSTLSSATFALRLYVGRISQYLMAFMQVEATKVRCTVVSVTNALPSTASCLSALMLGVSSGTCMVDPLLLGGLSGLQCMLESTAVTESTTPSIGNAILIVDAIILVALLGWTLTNQNRETRKWWVIRWTEMTLVSMRVVSMVLLVDCVVRMFVSVFV